MASSSSSSLILPFLSPKSLFLSKPTTKSSPSSLFFNSFSLKTTTTTTTTTNNNKSFSISSAFNSERSYNKSVTSEFDQEENEQVAVSSGRADLNFDQDELKLYVGNLSINVDSAQLVELFKRAGNVQMAKVIYDKMTGRSRGFAFVQMSTVEEAKAAAKKFHGFKLERKEMNVQYGPPPSRDKYRSKDPREGGDGVGGSSARCYVGNLAWNVDDEVLMTLFDVPGKVLEARVVYDRESGRSMGFGFVTYGSYEEVENAISSLNGFELNGKKIRVCASEERQRQRLAYSNDLVPINES